MKHLASAVIVLLTSVLAVVSICETQDPIIAMSIAFAGASWAWTEAS